MSSVPDIVDGIVAFATPVFAPTEVKDGPPVGAWPDQDLFIVGWSRSRDGIVVEQIPAGFVSTDQETFNVICVISCVGDDTMIKPIRVRAFAYLSTLAALIRQDKTLGGAATNARISAYTVAQDLQPEAGGAVEISLVITCLAYI